MVRAEAIAALRAVTPPSVGDAEVSACIALNDPAAMKATIKRWWRAAPSAAPAAEGASPPEATKKKAAPAKDPAPSKAAKKAVRKDWWRSLPASECDPISLEPLKKLRRAPFVLEEDGHAYRFDGRVLAAYLVSPQSIRIHLLPLRYQ